MIQALLKREVPLSEDAMTRAIFGSLEALPSAIICEMMATLPEPLVASGSKPRLSPPIEWEFWPPWIPDEPDLVLTDERHLCIIESKLGAAFGTLEDRGPQLERYWRYGQRLSRKNSSELWLVAVTADISPPARKIRQQLANTNAVADGRVLWMSWTAIARFVEAQLEREPHPQLRQILAVTELAGLAPFKGYQGPKMSSDRWKMLGASTWKFGEADV